jgi:N-methylhydantoinase A
MSRYRVAVDVGGTFTDLIVHDEESGSVAIAKTASIPADPAAAMVAGNSGARETGYVWRVVGAVSQRWA